MSDEPVATETTLGSPLPLSMPESPKPARTQTHMRIRSQNKSRFSRIIPVNVDNQPSKQQQSPLRKRNDTDEFDFGDSPEQQQQQTQQQTQHQQGHQRRSSSASERILELRGSGKRNWFPPLNQLDNGQSLIIRRIQKTKEKQTQQTQHDVEIGLDALKHDFALLSYDGVNWEFWAHVVGDYDQVARNQPDKLRKAIQDGFPNELRSLLWQIISHSKSSSMETLFNELVKVTDAPCLNSIEKDLDRTPMASQVERSALANVLKAYSLFDPEVGYTQGMAFVAVLLLMQLHEAEAFSLFAQLMKVYDFRSVYIAEMPGLHLKLYQFDRLVEDNLEIVHTHLKRQGVQSSMYASQWFLTMFAYRFPADLVTRIFDIVIAEGLEAILRFALALMQVRAKKILQLESLDLLLPFLKNEIFEGLENDLVRLASDVTLSPQVLSKYELEYQELNRLEKERMMQMDVLRSSNARLSLQNRQLDDTLEVLNKEHVEMANKMVTDGMKMVKLTDENFELKERLKLQSLQLEEMNSKHTKLSMEVTKAEEQAVELVRAQHTIEELKSEIALLKRTEGCEEKANLLQEVDKLREMNKRYETQLGSLQESLASALTDHHR